MGWYRLGNVAPAVPFAPSLSNWNLQRLKKINSQIYQSPAGICQLKVNNKNTRTRRDICSKLTIKTPELRQWCRFGVFIVSSEHISHLLVFLLLTLNM